MKLHPDWKNILLKAWTVRFSLLLAIVGGLYSVWPAFQWVVPLPVYAATSVVMALIICVARITGQKGFEGVE